MIIGKEIPSYENEYSITESGKVWSIKSNKFLSTSDDGHGYSQCNLSKNGEVKTFKIYKLVALTYLPNVGNKPCINHKDGNKNNNNYTNLEWCDYSHNLKHAWDHGMRRRDRLLKGKRRRAILLDPEDNVHYVHGLHEFCIQNNLSLSNLYKVFNGTRSHHKGWRGALVIEDQNRDVISGSGDNR